MKNKFNTNLTELDQFGVFREKTAGKESLRKPAESNQQNDLSNSKRNLNQVSKDNKEGTIYGESLVTAEGELNTNFSGKNNNTQFVAIDPDLSTKPECIEDEKARIKNYSEPFSGATVDFLKNNLEHALLLLPNFDISPNLDNETILSGLRRKHLKPDDKGDSFGFSVNAENEDLIAAAEMFKKTVLPTLEKLTNGGIYFDPNGKNKVLFKRIESGMGMALSTFNETSDQCEILFSDLKKSVNKTSDMWLHMDKNLPVLAHEFLHNLGFGHPHNSLPLLNVTDIKNNDTNTNISLYQKRWNPNLNTTNETLYVTPKGFEQNTMMSYAHQELATVTAAHFAYIMDPENGIWNEIPLKAQNAISEFYNKYKDSLELDLTPLDICSIEAQFSNGIAKEELAATKIKDYLEHFLFTYKEKGVLNHVGTGKEISIFDVQKYCPKFSEEEIDGFVRNCHLYNYNISGKNITNFNNITFLNTDNNTPIDNITNNKNITDTVEPASGNDNSKLGLIALAAIPIVALSAFLVKKFRRRDKVQKTTTDLKQDNKPSSSDSKPANQIEEEKDNKPGKNPIKTTINLEEKPASLIKVSSMCSINPNKQKASIEMT